MEEALEGTKILIIDEAEDTRDALFYIFKKKGSLVETARNGEEALGMVLENKPDIIILNITLSEIDAFETGRQLRENPETQDIPIIFLFASKDLSGIIYQLPGMPGRKVEYIEKPCNIADLIGQVNKLVALTKHYPPATG